LGWTWAFRGGFVIQLIALLAAWVFLLSLDNLKSIFALTILDFSDRLIRFAGTDSTLHRPLLLASTYRRKTHLADSY
jgi:hypothetical protein